MRYFELYSGIGGWRAAFNAIAKDMEIECKCVGYAEIDPLARQIYRNYFKPGENEMEVANFFPFRETIDLGKPIPVRPGRKVDELEYGSFEMLVADIPCEIYTDLEDDTTSLFSNIRWVAYHYRPELVLIEAPWNMATYGRGASLQSIINTLQSFGYYCSFTLLNAKFFGIPQERPKVYIFGSQKHEPYSFEFSQRMVSSEDWVRYPSVKQYRSVLDILDKEPSDKGIWVSDQSKKFIFADSYNGKQLHHTLNGDPAMSLKPGMSKTLRANADNYYTRRFIESGGRINEALLCDQSEWKNLPDIRRLLIRECCLLQGFDDGFYDAAIHSYASDTALYKMIGQSTNVNMAYAALHYIFNEFGIR